MLCTSCGTENRDGVKFCDECGRAFPSHCHCCGAENRPGAKFCNECGISLTAEMTPPIAAQEEPQTQVESPRIATHTPAAAERRQLTVMFCDLVGSTQLSAQLDPEDLRDVIRAYQSTSTEVIERYEGYIAQHLGDGLMVYFGWPQAHEDDIQRAVHAGLGIVEAMGRLNERLEHDQDFRLAVRIGIHTGPVVIGKIGSGASQEQLALGETPNVAARLQDLAEADTVVLSATAYGLVQGYFECEDAGEQALRGVAEPVGMYRVLRESGAQNRLDAAASRLTPIIGRDAEVTLLLQRWEQVKHGEGRVILLSGEPGIGKTKIVQTLRDHVAKEAHTRLECRSSPYFTHSALYPIVDLLQRTLQFQGDATPEDKLLKLETSLTQFRLPLEESVPLFAPLLSLSVPEERYPPLNLSPQRQRQKVLEAIVALVFELAEQQPVLFILEDLHWTDPSTLELLNLIIDQSPTAAIYVLLTCRPEFEPTWSHRSYLTEMTLDRLSRSQIESLATHVAGGHTLPDEVMDQLVERTDGVPLYIEEMTKTVLESGSLREVDGQYEVTGSISSWSIPSTLQDSLMARLDRLVTAKGVAQYASVIGRQFSYELLQAVSQLDEAMLQHELGRLVEAEVLYQRGLPPKAQYIFKHALIQDTAYESLLRRTRQHYHQRIAEVMESQVPDAAEQQPELLAYHLTAAGLHQPALGYWHQAGQHASQRSANQEAMAHFENALTALSHLPPDPETQAQAIALHHAMCSVHVLRGDLHQGLQCLEVAEGIADQLGDPGQMAQVLASTTHHFYLMTNFAAALERGQRGLELARASGDVPLELNVKTNLGLVHFALGNYHRAKDIFEQSVSAYEGDLCHIRSPMGLALVRSYDWLACSLVELGAFSEGLACCEEAARLSKTDEHPGNTIFTDFVLGRLFLRQGDIQSAIVHLERALEDCSRAGIGLWLPQISAHLGLAYALCGRIVEALPLLDQVVAQRHAPGNERAAPVLSMAGEAYLLAGRVEDALDLGTRAHVQSQELKQRGMQVYALRLLGKISAHTKRIDIEPSEIYYRQALALADELGMRPLQAHCYRDFGTLYRQIGQVEQARAELTTAIEMYRDMEMAFWLPETEAALAEVEGR